MTTIPDFMPVLSNGSHDSGEGKACVMEYVSLLAGEEWSDSPSCTHRMLAAVARGVNDSVDDVHRHLLVPLIGRLFGTSDVGSSITLDLTTWCLTQLDDISPTPVTEISIGAAVAYGESVFECFKNRNTEYIYMAERCAMALLRVIADTCWVDSGWDNNGEPLLHYDEDAGATKMIDFLSKIIDQYDRLSGRTDIREVSETDLAKLRQTVSDLVTV